MLRVRAMTPGIVSLTVVLAAAGMWVRHSGAIRGGAIVSAHAAPYMAELSLRGSNGSADRFVCSGTLIDPWWVLTAGHCAAGFVGAPGALSVTVGGGRASSSDHVYVDPGWSSAGAAYLNDAGLVHLSRPDTVHLPVELAESADAPRWDPCGATRTFGGCGSEAGTAGAHVEALGFGGCGAPCATPVLRQATLNVLSYSQLRSAYAASTYSPLVARAYDDMVIGAGVPGGTADSCDGDSGGPLVANMADGGWREVALTSWSEGACGNRIPNGVYMQLGAGPVRRWIESMVPSTLDPDPSPAAGYWLTDGSGHVSRFGSADDLGDAATAGATHIEATPNGHGYWIVNAAGVVYAKGNAPRFGNAPPLPWGECVISISATRAADGYWLFTNRGRVLAFGNAPFFGDLSGAALNGPVVDSVATPSGKGYYLIASDGGVFAFGDARFHGSMGGRRLNQPVADLVPTADNHGYWLVAADGGVFAFGDAHFHGSMGDARLNAPVVGMVRYGAGYLMVASDGGVFDFSAQPFAGSLADDSLPAPVIGIAATR